MVEKISPDDHSFLLEYVLRPRRARCKAHLRFLRETAGRRRHRIQALDALRAVRADLARVEGGDVALAQAIQDQLFEEPVGVREGLLRLEFTRRRRTPDDLRTAFQGLLLEHEAWLDQFDARHLHHWERQLADGRMVEGAIWEALCRRWLLRFVDSIAPAEDQREGGPDFHCSTRGLSFHVEAGSISIDAATRVTGLHDLDGSGGPFGLGTERTVEVVERKVSQCAVHRSTPTVLFLGTLHQTAALHSMGERVARNLLTGAPEIAFRVVLGGGGQIGSSGPQSTTRLHGAAFVTADGSPPAPIGPRNRHVAAVLVGSAGMFWDRDPLAPPPFVGALHPDPVAPFDPLRGLPGVRFFGLDDAWRRGRMKARVIQRTSAAKF